MLENSAMMQQPSTRQATRAGEVSARILDEPYPLLARVSLALALVGGFGLGLTLVLSFVLQAPLPAGVGPLIQAHGQVQTLGFVTLFILAVGTRLLPRFHGTHLERGSLASIGGLVLAVGVVLRAVGQPLPQSTARSAMLVASGLLILGGILLAVLALGDSVRRGSSPREREPMLLPITMALSLLISVILTLAASVGLASGWVTVPVGMDEAILHLQLWGFASTMILAIGRHTWPSLLVLRPSGMTQLRRGLALWAVGSLGVPIVWLLAPEATALRAIPVFCQFAGLALYVRALHLFEAPARPSLIPLVTDAGRAWVRTAFAFGLAAAAINVAAALPGVIGSSQPVAELSAARHALAQGFVLPVMVFMAARILPGYSARMVAHPGRLAVLMTLLFAGAALRVLGELIGGYSDVWGLLVALGGTLTTAGFLVFAAQLWGTTTRTTPRHREAARSAA